MKTLFWLLLFPLFLFSAESRTIVNLTLYHADKVTTKIILSALNSVGQRPNISRFESLSDTIFLEMELQGTRPFDAQYFSEIVKENGVNVVKETYQKNKWIMELDGSSGHWNLSEITPDEGAQMEKSASPSWFIVNHSSAITIEAPYGGKWYPDVAVFDANMEVLVSLREFKSKERLSFSLPEGAVYMKVSSANGMKLLKEGTWIEHTAGER
ncbi:MAG: hypothetical protein PHW18_00185 [Sulfuricurvum sp.]|uniref:hypothetical protein n=1 Tax=Sulfuricurvum sp. TaxID=2025608 RepID=UPI00261E5D43|nr:hypothetical protein [Sulfuricurvum sp.]MDD2827972.1 hypothetical protein [Sulfuricurvum sp.]MDD4948151.1 hypothetical protein [Sulfuricurvum sp.]